MCKEAERIKESDEVGIYTVELAHSMPAIINMAFACELAIKSLLSQADRTHIHKLRELFDKLDQQLQIDIKGRVIAEVRLTNDNAFFAKLDECSNNFVEWRYFYENGHGSIHSHNYIMKAMVEEILDRDGIEYL